MIIANGYGETSIVGPYQIDKIPWLAFDGQFLTFASIGRLVFGRCKGCYMSIIVIFIMFFNVYVYVNEGN